MEEKKSTFFKEVEKFIPYYPEETRPKFSYDIAKKKEFQQFRLTGAPSSDRAESRQLQPHQEIVKRYVSPFTLYDGLLVYHGLGSGKTLGALAVAENNRTDVPALVIVKNALIAENFREQLEKHFGERYRGAYRVGDDPTLRPEEEAARVRRQRDTLINQNYTIVTMIKLANDVKKLTSAALAAQYSGRVIIIDEAHNIKPSGQGTVLYDAVTSLLQAVTDCKTILLTATPMWDVANQLVPLMKLIDPKLPLEQKTFDRNYFDPDGVFLSQGTREGVPDLVSLLQGKISYLRTGVQNVSRVDGGDKTGFVLAADNKKVPVSQKFNVVLAPMTQAHYNAADKRGYPSHKSDPTSFAYLQQRHGEIFTLPNGTHGSQVTKRTIQEAVKRLCSAGDSVDQKIQKIKEWAPIFGNILKEIHEHPEELVFVFLENVQGTGGQRSFAQLLHSCLGSAVTYRVIGGDVTETQKREILERFNSDANAGGKKIQVLIGGHMIREGINLQNVGQVHVLPHWNFSLTEQAIGRAIRIGSHRTLSERKFPHAGKVKVFYHVAVGPLWKRPNLYLDTAMAYMLRTAEAKYLKVLQVRRFLKKIAFDCPLTYAANVLPNHKDYSLECEFSACNYACEGFPSESIKKREKTESGQSLWDYAIPVEQLEVDTFDAYYSSRKETIAKVLEFFQSASVLTWKELLPLSQVGSSKFSVSASFLLQTLQFMIEGNHRFHNRFGFVCCLREDQDTFFLVPLEDATDRTQKKEVALYTQYPILSHQQTLEELNALAGLENDKDEIERLLGGGNVSFSRLNPETQFHLLEKAFAYECLRLQQQKPEMPNVQAGNKKIFSQLLGEIYLMDDRRYVHSLYSDFRAKQTGSAHASGTQNVVRNGRLRMFNPATNRWADVPKVRENAYANQIELQRKKKKRSADIFEACRRVSSSDTREKN